VTLIISEVISEVSIMKRAYWVLIATMFLVLGLDTLALALASESSEVVVSTDKDVYAIGENVISTVSMDPLD